MRTLHLAALLTFATTAAAQCGTVAFTGTGAAGTSLSVAVTGTTAGGLVVLGVSQNTGTTNINIGPLGLNLTLGLDTPILPLPLGRANGSGSITRSIDVPAGITQQFTLQAQAVTTTLSIFPFSFTACASNVTSFTIG